MSTSTTLFMNETGGGDENGAHLSAVEFLVACLGFPLLGASRARDMSTPHYRSHPTTARGLL